MHQILQRPPVIPMVTIEAGVDAATSGDWPAISEVARKSLILLQGRTTDGK